VYICTVDFTANPLLNQNLQQVLPYSIGSPLIQVIICADSEIVRQLMFLSLCWMWVCLVDMWTDG